MSWFKSIVFIWIMFVNLANCYEHEELKLKPCKPCDRDCIKESAQSAYQRLVRGIPSLGITCSEPIHQSEMHGNIGKLAYNFTDNLIAGFSNCNVHRIKTDDFTFHLELLCANLTLMGKYSVNGELSEKQHEEKGHYKIFCPKYKLGIETKIDEVMGEDEKIHLRLKTMSTYSDAVEELKINLDNCKEKKDLEKFLNHNWKEVAMSLQGPFVDKNLKILATKANKYLESVCLADMFLDEDDEEH